MQPQQKKTVTQAEFRRDPARVIRDSESGPVEVLNESGTRILTISCPYLPDDADLGCPGDLPGPLAEGHAGLPVRPPHRRARP